MRSSPAWPAVLLLATSVALLASCGDRAPVAEGPLLPAEVEQVVITPGWGVESADTPARTRAAKTLEAAKATASLALHDPQDGSVFPPDITAPTIRWTDSTPEAKAWLLRIRPEDDAAPLEAYLEGLPPRVGEIDPTCIAPTNELPDPPGAYDHAWTVPPALWTAIKERTSERWATLTLTGFDPAAPDRAFSRAEARIRTSKDPVGAPIFYRDVPLAPAETQKGTIKPLAESAVGLIKWRLRDVSKPESRVVLEHMPTCANCHSFSNDGSTFGMDVDGPQGDKGTYAILPVAKNLSIGYDDIITWNDFPGKNKGQNTLGFLSRVSPTGRYVLSTVNEALYVANFTNYEFLQVFYPTRGIFALYDRKTEKMTALPGADDPDYVHTNPVWTPDGKTIVFSRAKARDPYIPGRPLAKFPNDPNETPIQYNLVRMPFNDGKGGTPEPIPGAYENGWSNTFPKVSPDGKWIVFVRCKNGQLMRPDGKLFILPFEGGEPREMRCNTWRMNSWHSFSPNGRWLVFSSKANTPYTQMFLTHLDEDGNDTPPILVPNATAANRAVNIPEFMNRPYDALESIEVPGVDHRRKTMKGYALMGEGQVDDALKLFQEAIRLNPRDARAHLNLGWALAAKGRDADALRAYEQAVALDPEYGLACNNLGNALMERNAGPEDLHRALDLFRKALELDPTLMRARRNLAYALYRMDRLDEALAAYVEIVQREPRNAPAHGSMSSILFRLGRPAEAMKELELAVSSDPGDVQAKNTLAWVLATFRDPAYRDGERAVRLAEELAEKTGRRDANVLDTLAAAYAEVGRYPDAVKVAEEALGHVRDEDGGLRKAIQARRDRYREERPFRS